MRDRLWGWVLGLIIVLVGFGLVVMAVRWSDIAMLPLATVDEDTFVQVIAHMWTGFHTGSIKTIATYSFYTYGLGYFLLAFLAALPGFLMGHCGWVVVAPRLLSSMAALGSLGLIYGICSQWAGRRGGLIAIIGVLTHAMSCPHAKNNAAIPFGTCPLTPIDPVCAPPTKLILQ